MCMCNYLMYIHMMIICVCTGYIYISHINIPRYTNFRPSLSKKPFQKHLYTCKRFQRKQLDRKIRALRKTYIIYIYYIYTVLYIYIYIICIRRHTHVHSHVYICSVNTRLSQKHIIHVLMALQSAIQHASLLTESLDS